MIRLTECYTSAWSSERVRDHFLIEAGVNLPGTKSCGPIDLKCGASDPGGKTLIGWAGEFLRCWREDSGMWLFAPFVL